MNGATEMASYTIEAIEALADSQLAGAPLLASVSCLMRCADEFAARRLELCPTVAAKLRASGMIFTVDTNGAISGELTHRGLALFNRLRTHAGV